MRVNVDGIDYEELGLYISFNQSPDERVLGLDLVCPTLCNQIGGRIPLLTVSGIIYQKSKRVAPWIPAVSP